jgi:hypothetical protein
MCEVHYALCCQITWNCFQHNLANRVLLAAHLSDDWTGSVSFYPCVNKGKEGTGEEGDLIQSVDRDTLIRNWFRRLDRVPAERRIALYHSTRHQSQRKVSFIFGLIFDDDLSQCNVAEWPVWLQHGGTERLVCICTRLSLFWQDVSVRMPWAWSLNILKASKSC